MENEIQVEFMFHLFESVKSNEMSYPSYYRSTFASKVNGFFFQFLVIKQKFCQ